MAQAKDLRQYVILTGHVQHKETWENLNDLLADLQKKKWEV
jgi:hypothetical protein